MNGVVFWGLRGGRGVESLHVFSFMKRDNNKIRSHKCKIRSANFVVKLFFSL